MGPQSKTPPLPSPPIYVKYVRTHPDMKSFALKLSYPGLENVTYIFILNILVHKSILLAINISEVHIKVKWQKNRKSIGFLPQIGSVSVFLKKPSFGSVFRFTEQHYARHTEKGRKGRLRTLHTLIEAEGTASSIVIGYGGMFPPLVYELKIDNSPCEGWRHVVFSAYLFLPCHRALGCHCLLSALSAP